MRQLAIGTNIKMYLGYAETVGWMRRIAHALGPLRGVELFAFVPAICLTDARAILAGSPVGYGSQNMHWAEAGPYTGELSAGMLRELGCTHVELGHMERRRYFGETDREVSRKLRRAIDAQLRAVVCLGEERQGPAAEVHRALADQLAALLAGVRPDEAGRFLLAYEPAWAIGADVAAPAAYVEEMHGHLRRVAGALLGPAAAERLTIVYGGSVTPAAAPELCLARDVDGLFVGRSALDVDRFAGIIADALRARARAAAHQAGAPTCPGKGALP